jgi:hypothetical protein
VKNYDSLRQKKKNVTLLEGESLINELSNLYGLPQSAVVAAKLKQFTELQYSSMDLAYYGEQFYWVFMFPGRDIAVLSAAGEPAGAALLAAKTLAKAALVRANVTFASRYPTFVSAFVALVLAKVVLVMTKTAFVSAKPATMPARTTQFRPFVRRA